MAHLSKEPSGCSAVVTDKAPARPPPAGHHRVQPCRVGRIDPTAPPPLLNTPPPARSVAPGLLISVSTCEKLTA
jgi:hypothetical protein